MQKSPKRKWILIGVAVVVILALASTLIQKYSSPKGTEVTLAMSETREIRETVSASGKVFPESEVKISSDVSGEIVELYVKEGDSVVVGQVLAKINPDTYISAVERGEASVNSSKAQLAISRAQIESSTAQKEQITAQLENARTIHKRNDQLKKDGVISQAEFDQSLATLKQLEANFRASEASIRSAQQNAQASEFSINGAMASLKELRTSLSRTTIKAPSSGIVSKLSVEQGERVVGTIQMTGTEMMRISNLNVMEVQVDVSENDILKVKVGDEADIEVDAYIGKKFKGSVTEIASSASNITATAASLNTDQVTNFVVRIRMDEKSYQDIITDQLKYPMRPGMSASVDIYTDEVKGAVAVPIQCVAVREKGGAKKMEEVPVEEGVAEPEKKEMDFDEVVFVMESDTVKMIKVVTGIQDDEFIEIKEGLKAGQQVISGPYVEVSKNLKSGDTVRKKKEEEEKK